MNLKLILSLLAILLVVSHAEVTILDDSNYTAFIQEHPYVFVKFYAPWCGHCKAMASDYEKLALTAEGKEYVIAHVDCTIAKNVSQTVGVDGYPTLKLIVQGNPIDYPGERNYDEMLKWLDNTMNIEIKTITEPKVKELIGSTDFLLVQGASSDQLKFIRFAQKEGGVQFYSLEGGDFKIILYLKNTKTLEYDGKVNPQELSSWIFQSTLNAFTTLSNNDAVKHVFEGKYKLPALLLLRNKDWTEALSETILEVCEENKLKFLCGWASEEHDIHQGISRFLKSESAETSILVYFDFGIKNGWKMPEPTSLTKQSLLQFVKDAQANTIEKFHDEAKEEAEGKGKNKDASRVEFVEVLQLTVDSFNTTIQENDSVFVIFYSPTCGHCVTFAPEYEQLAQVLKGNESSYVIAAVDMTKHGQLGNYVNINGYPTLRFYHKGSEFDYEGERSVTDMIQYMDKVVANKLPTISSMQSIERPAIAVSGIDENSSLQRLNMKVTKYPIYWVQGTTEFKVEIFDKNHAEYTGDQHIDAIANWIEDMIEEIIVNIAQPQTSKKLNKALESQTPILLIMNRDNSEAFKAAHQLLESFCQGKLDFICGIAATEDKEYESFNEWIKDPIKDQSRIIYLKTEKFEKYLYEGDLAALDADALENFIKDVKAGKVEEHDAQVESDKAEADATMHEEGDGAESGTPEEVKEPVGEVLDIGEPAQTEL